MHLTGNSVVFTLPGIHYYQCLAPVTNDSKAITEFRVVTAQHKVAICRSNNISCTREMQVNVGDVVYWTTQFDNDTDCSSIVLVNATCSETSFQQYYLTATGKFAHIHSTLKLITQVFSIFKYSSN